MGYYISKLESLPNIFDWYFFLVGDYRNHGLINDLFNYDFRIIADRLGSNAALIAENHSLERELQECLKNYKIGELGAYFHALEKRHPGLLILNKHPKELSRVLKNVRDPIVFYISFEILEMTYSSGNALISDILALSKNQDFSLINKTLEFGCEDTNIEDLVQEDEIRIKTITNNGKAARCIKCKRIIYLDEHKHKDKCVYCGYMNNVQEAIINRFIIAGERREEERREEECTYGHTIKGQGIDYREVLEAEKELFNSSYPMNNEEGKKDMETILIITALKKELEPVLNTIVSPLRNRLFIEMKNGRKYYIYKESATLTIICTSFLEMGQVNAALAIQDAVNSYGISKVIMTGICGGIDRTMKYGDIIISDQIVNYDLAKIKSNELVEVRWDVYRSDFELVQSMRMHNDGRWSSYLKREFPESKYEKPSVYSGIVLSGNKVIANYEEVKRFTQTWAKALAVEMEAGGISAALHRMQNPPSFVMVKAICDFADSEKSDDWQEYAAYASAVFVLDYVFNECASLSKKESKQPISSPIYENQRLFSAIRGTYNLSEINVLAFNIGIDLEEISGTGKSEKIVELIKYCQRRNLLNRLISQINIERNNILIEYEEC